MTNSLYMPIIVLLLGAVAFALTPLLLAWLWARIYSPHKPGASKNAVYECGLESEGDAWIQFKPGFSAAESIAMLIFLLLLVEGLVWAYQKKVLVWT